MQIQKFFYETYFICIAILDTGVWAQCLPVDLHKVDVPVKVSHNPSIHLLIRRCPPTAPPPTL